jgi:UDP-GlcNAc:undecaprenyl-phosphate GlcNAc-1-phosphate transferase
VRAYLLVMAVAAVVTFLTTSPVRGAAVRLRALSPVRDRDVHATPVPRLGGVAILSGFAAALGLASTVPFLAGTFGEGLSGPLGILLAAAVITGVGVVDDLVGLDAITKLVGQALAGVVMATFGVQLLVVPIGVNDIVLMSGWALTALTVAVVVVTVNAVNFVDGLDGLAAGIVVIAGTALFAYSYLLSVAGSPEDLSSTASLVTAATVGACLGFLPHNLHPARIFMGDSGALLLGLLLAASTISLTGSVDPAVLGRIGVAPAFLPLLLPVAALIVPVADVGLAVLRRTAAGRSPFSPDKQHLHHRMLEIGHGHRAAVALLHAWVALLAFGVVATAFWPWQEVLVVAAAATVVVAVLTVVPLLVRRVARMPVTEDGVVLAAPPPRPDVPAQATSPDAGSPAVTAPEEPR